MPDRFQWQSEDDGWDRRVPDESGKPRRKKRIWLLIPIIFALFVVTAFLARNVLDQQVTATENTIEEDIIAAHLLVTTAAAQRDQELFTSLVTTSDSFWSDTQQTMLEYGLLLDRPPLGIWALPAAEPAQVQVSLNPQLTEAEVSDRYPFFVESATGITETIYLTRTAVYRREDKRWLLAPLPDDRSYWGQWETIVGDYLTLVFATREATIGERLAADLDGMVGELCAAPEVHCPVAMRFQLRLARDTAVMLHLRDSYDRLNVSSSLSTKVHLDLPSPLLIGLPSDEMGYETLYNGYASWVAALIAHRSTTPSVADPNPVPELLARLGLRPPPPIGYQPVAVMLPPPIPFPNQDVLLLCAADGARPQLWRFRPEDETWRPADVAFKPLDVREIIQLLSHPADEGVLVTVRLYVEDRPRYRSYVLQGGSSQLLADTAHTHSVLSWLLTQRPDDDRYLPIYEWASEEMPEGQVSLLDRDRCEASGCPLTAISGLPLWSEDERATLIMEIEQWPAQITLGDGRAEPVVPLDRGWSPLWLAEDVVGLVRPLGGGGDFEFGQQQVEVVSRQVDVESAIVSSPTQLITSETLFSIMAATPGTGGLSDANDVFVESIYRHPAHPAQLFVGAIAISEIGLNRQFLFAYDQDLGTAKLLFEPDGTSASSPYFSESGRFLTTMTVTRANLDLTVFDLVHLTESTYRIYTTSQYPYPSFDWSADDSWLIIAEDQGLRLIAPAYGYELAAYHTISGCRTAVWTNR